jgi:hypothetical protein
MLRLGRGNREIDWVRTEVIPEHVLVLNNVAVLLPDRIFDVVFELFEALEAFEDIET